MGIGKLYLTHSYVMAMIKIKQDEQPKVQMLFKRMNVLNVYIYMYLLEWVSIRSA
jgi:hypothetical protein